MGKVSDELADRMLKLIREMGDAYRDAESPADLFKNVGIHHHMEARAIQCALSDPDTQASRDLVRELFPNAAPENEWALQRVAIEGIKLGRILEKRA